MWLGGQEWKATHVTKLSAWCWVKPKSREEIHWGKELMSGGKNASKSPCLSASYLSMSCPSPSQGKRCIISLEAHALLEEDEDMNWGVEKL